MPVMSTIEQCWCRSTPWRAFTGRVVLPWTFRHRELAGEVLEIGSGAGANAAELLRRYPAVRLTATDVDRAMVDTTRRRLEPFGQRALVTEADATRLPFPDGSFDAVVSLIMLHHVIDWEAAIAEARRVLRPGGALVGYDLVHTGPARLLHRLDRSPHRLVATDELHRHLREVGFEDVHVAPSLAGVVARFHATAPTTTPVKEEQTT